MGRTGFVPAPGAAGGTPSRESTSVVGIPAPIGGINAVDPLASVQPIYCLSAINLVADGRTLRSRPGYQEWATTVGNGNGVRGILPFEAADVAQNKLFATCENGIFDITAGGAIGAAAISYTTGSTAGYGVWTMFVADNSSHYMFYADPVNGLYRYVEGGAWTAVTDITGVNELNLVFAAAYKGRMWFAEKNSARGWYLAPGAISGAATRFDFGNKFKHGGRLVGLYSWTVDGGEGVDDHLVAISSSGDVMVYKGSDPSSAATWDLKGQYYIGAVPAGFRIAQGQGGDLFLLSQYGVIPLTRIMQGMLVEQGESQLSRNIAPLIAGTMTTTRNSLGWEMRNIPSSNCFLVGTPKVDGQPALQYVLSTQTQGWTIWNNLPYLSGDVYLGTFYFGNTANKVYKLTGDKDAVTAAGTGGNDIAWSGLTAFTDFGQVGNFHRAQFVRMTLISGSAPGAAVAARYDYDLSDAPPATTAGEIAAALWDVALWDTAVWGSSNAVYTKVFGVSGIGRAVAVAFSGSSNTATGLVRLDLFGDAGGGL